MSVAEPRHGTTTGYGAARCRCDECRAANAKYFREYRERQLGKKGTIARGAAVERERLIAQIERIGPELAKYADGEALIALLVISLRGAS